MRRDTVLQQSSFHDSPCFQPPETVRSGNPDHRVGTSVQMQSRTSVSSRVPFSRDYSHIRDQFSEIISNGEPRKVPRLPGKIVALRLERHGPTVGGHPA